MATPAQIELIEDLLEEHDLLKEGLAELADEPSWADYEMLGSEVCSEIIDWLRDYPRWAADRGNW